MVAVLQITTLLLACAGVAVAEGQKGVAKPSPPPRAPVVRPAVPRPNLPKNGGAPKQPRIGPPLSNPMSPAARLYRATPEQRDRALEKLPPQMQEQIRRQLAAFDALPKEQQEAQIQTVERLDALSPQRKLEIRQQMQAFQKLPQERRGAIAIALRRLYFMPESDRQKILNGDDFKSRFSADEQKIISDLSDVFLPK